MEPTIIVAIVAGIFGILTKSNILLIIAGLIFLLGFLPVISIPTPAWIAIILIIVFIVISKKKS